MSKWKIRGIKFAAIVVAGAATGLTFAFTAWWGGNVGSCFMGWSAGAVTAAVAAAALVWHPNEA